MYKTIELYRTMWPCLWQEGFYLYLYLVIDGKVQYVQTFRLNP